MVAHIERIAAESLKKTWKPGIYEELDRHSMKRRDVSQIS
jgi:hypothetical protein